MTSLQVAESFEKEHKNVLRDIEAILPQVPEKFVKLNFELYEYPIETGIGTRMAKSYLLSKDAFTLLTMGLHRRKGYGLQSCLHRTVQRDGKGPPSKRPNLRRFYPLAVAWRGGYPA